MAKRETGPATPSIPAGAQYSESPDLSYVERDAPVDARPGNPGGATPSAKITSLSKIDDSRSEIVKWGNGEETAAETITLAEDEPAPTTTDAPAERTKPPAKPAKEKPDDETTEEATPAAAKPPVDADKRRQILESLDKEKNRVGMENRIKEEQEKREAVERERDEFNKSPLGRKLATIAKQHGMSLDDLKDKLLIGADDVLDKPDAAAPAKPEKDPEVVALLAWKAEKEKAEDDAKIQQSIGHVREALKETDLPMIDAFDAYGRVLVKAHAGWVAGGKKGTVAEFVPSAADIVEDELKAERPNAAKRLYPKAEEETAEAAEVPVARATPRPAMGKRQAAKPGVKPAPLPMDPYERSQEIKRRQGWL